MMSGNTFPEPQPDSASYPMTLIPKTEMENFSQIIKKQKLTLANGLVVCRGTITRKLVTTIRTEQSAISCVLIRT